MHLDLVFEAVHWVGGLFIMFMALHLGWKCKDAKFMIGLTIAGMVLAIIWPLLLIAIVAITLMYVILESIFVNHYRV